ncbi:MAG: hypothetical protein H7233_13495 [Pseudorhodobacter sp.]|nr:hypothetical protein [Frankiaceae bacterium]
MSRRQHYRDLYDGPVRDGRPLAVVHGNCQAEALRVLLSGSPSFPFQPVRVPPVHELEAGDLAAYDRLLAATSLLVSQPVSEDYRGLPLGTGQVSARLAPGAAVVVWPVVRWQGLHPWQAIVRAPDGAEPPVVPYHDLRTLTGRRPEGEDLLAAARDSTGELVRREAACDVTVSDLLTGADAVHTLNHPGNRVLLGLAHRVQARVGAPADAADPGRVLLGGVRAPLEPQVLVALGLDGRGLDDRLREHWLVAGQPVPAEDVVVAQAAWYATRPDVVTEGLRRYADRLALLGLSPR